jgi:hypothetical protein
MSKKTISIAGLGLVGLGSTFFAAPAVAAIDCGTAPSGGVLTQNGGVCQLSFETAGTYTFTSTQAMTNIWALIVAGGGGASISGSSEGYAGSGGEVRYADLVEDEWGVPYTILVGSGGDSSSSGGNPGQDSNMSNGISSFVTFGGAAGTMANGYCALQGNYSTYLGLGQGARTTSSTVNGETCGADGLGVNPSAGNVDSFGNSVPAVFSNLNADYGHGGTLVAAPTTLNSVTSQHAAGTGASVSLDLSNSTRIGNNDGLDGYVEIRWTPSGQLASTGSDSEALTWFGAGTIAAGMAFIARSRMRARRTNV